MSVRFKEEQEAQTTSDETTYEYSDGTIAVKRWSGEPLFRRPGRKGTHEKVYSMVDEVKGGTVEVMETNTVTYAVKGGTVGVVERVIIDYDPDAVYPHFRMLESLWFYQKESKTNYTLTFDGEEDRRDIFDSLFFLPPEASRIVNRIVEAMKRGVKEDWRGYKAGKAGYLAFLLVKMPKSLQGKVPMTYSLPALWMVDDFFFGSCARLVIRTSNLLAKIGVAERKKGVWLWVYVNPKFSYSGYRNTFDLIVARDEKELLDFLIGSEDGSRIARDIADALKYPESESWLKCEAGRKILDKIRMLFG